MNKILINLKERKSLLGFWFGFYALGNSLVLKFSDYSAQFCHSSAEQKQRRGEKAPVEARREISFLRSTGNLQARQSTGQGNPEV